MNNVKISLTGTYALLGLTISLGAEDSEELANVKELNIKEDAEEGTKEGTEGDAEKGAEEGAESVEEFNCPSIC